MAQKRPPTAVDAHIGARIKEARKTAGLSQEKLAAACDITFQQVQKYEKGSSRISASRLVQIAAILGYPVASFLPEHTGRADSLERQLKAAKATLEQIRLIAQKGAAT